MAIVKDRGTEGMRSKIRLLDYSVSIILNVTPFGSLSSLTVEIVSGNHMATTISSSRTVMNVKF